jgi:hypothetical protein
MAAAERITLSAKVREYFADIGRRGGSSSRRQLTRRQARLMVAIREAKRVARNLPSSVFSRFDSCSINFHFAFLRPRGDTTHVVRPARSFLLVNF